MEWEKSGILIGHLEDDLFLQDSCQRNVDLLVLARKV